MGFERDLEMYVNNTGWDINYKNGQVTNILGQKIDVRIEKAKSCTSIPGTFNAGDREIVIKEACDDYIDAIVASSKEELGAYTLAHELGHADSYPVVYLLSAAILSFGTSEAIRKRSLKTFAYTVTAGLLGSQILLNELLAETCATVYHDVPFLGASYQVMPGLLEKIGGWF